MKTTMIINQNKLEVKYALDIYSEIPGFPSHTDRIYVMIRALEEGDADGPFIGREFVAENIWIPMRSCVPTLKDFRNVLDSIADEGLPENDLFLQKTRTERGRGYYRLIRNPWM